MAASRSGVRGAASARAAGIGHVSADTTGGRSLRRCLTNGVAMPTATAPHASVRRARVLRKAAEHNRAGGRNRGNDACSAEEEAGGQRKASQHEDLALSGHGLDHACGVGGRRRRGRGASSIRTAARSGGALAQPTVQQRGGGHAAPPSARAGGRRVGQGGAAGGRRRGAPPHEAAQEDQPTTPGGEEQNGGEQNGPREPDEPVEEPKRPGRRSARTTTPAQRRAGCPRPGLELERDGGYRARPGDARGGAAAGPQRSRWAPLGPRRAAPAARRPFRRSANHPCRADGRRAAAEGAEHAQVDPEERLLRLSFLPAV